MASNRLVATFVVGVFLLGVPIAVALRLSDGLLPLRSMDLVLSIGAIGWVHFAKAIFERTDPVDSTSVHRTSLRWQAHALVEASVFGASSSIIATAVPRLATERLEAPSDDLGDRLPPPILTPVAGLIEAPDAQTSRTQVARPVLQAATSDDMPPIVATEPYTVARGDTYWSIAEVTLGEGRFWTAIRDLNLGREVAPGLALGADQDLRIGWSVLIPVVAENPEPVHG